MKTVLVFLLLPLLGSAQVKKPIDKEKSTVTYSMNHMLHAWEGTSTSLNGIVQIKEDGQIEKVAIVSKVSAFDSKSSNRDAHMLEVTEALKFPNISFSSNAISELPNGELDIKGSLQFHGVKKEIAVKGTKKSKGNTTIVNGNFIFLLEDFNVERPSFMLKKVDNEVKVSFEVYY
jgi:polyisoprenoid-binding protein YceI